MGDLGGCAKCSKYLLIVFNILFFLVGAAMLAVGIWVNVKPYNDEVLAILENPLIQNSGTVLIALGSFIMSIAGFGFGGACSESKCMLVIYFITVLLVFIAQIVACALVVAYRSTVDAFITDSLAGTMDDYDGANATDVTSTAWNALHILLGCCGTNNYTDWADTTWGQSASTYTVDGNTYTLEYPLTCCVFDEGGSALLTGTEWPAPTNLSACLGAYGTPDDTVLNTVGCYEAFETFVVDQVVIVGAVGLGLLVFELLVIVFAIILCRGISNGDSKVV